MHIYKRITACIISLVFISTIPAVVYAETNHTQQLRVYVAEPVITMQNGSGSDVATQRYTPVALSLSDMIGFTLTQLDRYKVYTPTDFSDTPNSGSTNIESATRVSTLEEARSLSERYEIDNVVFGTIEALQSGGTMITLSLFDRYENRVTVTKSSRTASILDTFDAADELSVALLEGFSGVRIAFGNLRIKNNGIDGAYSVKIDEKHIGDDLSYIDNLLTGTHLVTISHTKNEKTYTLLDKEIEIRENKTHNLVFSFPALFSDEKTHLLSLDEEIHQAWSVGNTDGALNHAKEAFVFSKNVYAPEVHEKYNRLVGMLENTKRKPLKSHPLLQTGKAELSDFVNTYTPETKMMSSSNMYFNAKIGSVSAEDLRYAVGKNLFNASLRAAHYISEEENYHPTINVTLPDFAIHVDKVICGLTDKKDFEYFSNSSLHEKQVIDSQIFWNNDNSQLSRDIAPPNITFSLSSVKKYGHIVIQFFYTKGEKSYSHYETIPVKPFTEHSSAPKITSKSSIDNSYASIEIQWTPSSSTSVKQQQVVISKSSSTWPHPNSWAYDDIVPPRSDSATIKLRKQPNIEYRAHICIMDERGHWSWISSTGTFTLP